MWAPSSQRTCPESSQWLVNPSRRRSTAAVSSWPVTACLAPSTRRAASRAWPGRSSALLGMHAQYEQSPPTRSASTTTADRPPFTTRSATFSPVDPAPITITSYSRSSAMRTPVAPLTRLGHHASQRLWAFSSPAAAVPPHCGLHATGLPRVLLSVRRAGADRSSSLLRCPRRGTRPLAPPPASVRCPDPDLARPACPTLMMSENVIACLGIIAAGERRPGGE